VYPIEDYGVTITS